MYSLFCKREKHCRKGGGFPKFFLSQTHNELNRMKSPIFAYFELHERQFHTVQPTVYLHEWFLSLSGIHALFFRGTLNG